MNLAKLLGIKYPIIQGGMANISNGTFAAAVSNAGGLGLIASGGFDADGLRAEIKTARSLTDKPFGVNIMLMHPQADELAKIIVEEKVPVVTTGAGNPGKYIESWREAGTLVFPVVASVALAIRMERAGATGVIAEGTESGGHVGELTTMALVPQVAAAVNIPVIAAGGIASSRQMLASLMLGACGVQIGTCLLVSEECPVHENYKSALLKASDTGTTVTGRSAGAPVRILKNKMARAYLQKEKEGASKEELEVFTLGSLRKAVHQGDIDNGSVMAGQVSGQLDKIRPVAEILKDLHDGCKELCKTLPASLEELL